MAEGKINRHLDWEEVPIEDIQPYKNNPKAHTLEQIAFVAKLIETYGWTQPICLDKDYEVVFGHCRLESAKSLGEATVPCVFREDLTEAQVKALRIADNKSNESAWIEERLEIELVDLQAMDVDLKDVGFGLEEMPGGGMVQEDDFNVDGALEEEPVTQVGDLWLLARHRVLCGDSTKREDVERVMDGEKAILMDTDPPYGCNAGNVGFTAQRDDLEVITKDDLEGKEMQEFLETVFIALLPSLAPNCAWYLWHPMLTQGYFAAAAAAAADLIIHRQIIWKKEMFIFGRGDYHWRHELCFYGWRRGNRPAFYGERNQDTVWEVPWGQKRSEVGHPTAKPIELFARPLRNHTQAGDICCDPFLGSGSQLIAADQLDRICYGMEIEPRYVDVTVKRYIAHKGSDEGVFLERDGVKIPYSEVMANV